MASSTSHELKDCDSLKMGESPITCRICLEVLDKQMVGKVNAEYCHLFCASCILEWWKDGNTTCPLDRNHIKVVVVAKNIKSVKYDISGFYIRACKICKLILDALNCVTCLLCLSKFHYSCVGLELREGNYKISCSNCAITRKKKY